MKLKEIKQKTDYLFSLTFQNGEVRDVDLKGLVGQYVTLEDLHTAEINSEWGCLEFLSCKVDIEPKTLYKYVTQNLEHSLR